MMDLAVFDRHVLSEDTDAVARGITDFTVTQRDIVGRDLDAVAALPVAVDQVVLIDARAW